MNKKIQYNCRVGSTFNLSSVPPSHDCRHGLFPLVQKKPGDRHVHSESKVHGDLVHAFFFCLLMLFHARLIAELRGGHRSGGQGRRQFKQLDDTPPDGTLSLVNRASRAAKELTESELPRSSLCADPNWLSSVGAGHSVRPVYSQLYRDNPKAFPCNFLRHVIFCGRAR